MAILKSEARNPKSECSKQVLNFDHLVFEIVSDFEIRISDLI